MKGSLGSEGQAGGRVALVLPNVAACGVTSKHSILLKKPPVLKIHQIQEIESSRGIARIDCGRLFLSDGSVLVVFSSVSF